MDFEGLIVTGLVLGAGVLYLKNCNHFPTKPKFYTAPNGAQIPAPTDTLIARKAMVMKNAGKGSLKSAKDFAQMYEGDVMTTSLFM